MADPNLPSVIQQMLQPDFYPHPVQASIQLIQTHISYILLTGDYAYKVKKPLNFGFLDYSTLEQRQHFCQEELRLNQRGAPEIYLEVLPITQSGSTYRLEGSGSAVEYTVKMRQFPQEAILSQMFDRGELSAELLERLAKVIADFHLRSPTNPEILSYGQPQRVREAFDENYEQTLAYIGGPQTQVQFDETRAYTDRFFAEKAALFEARIQQNWIRECHGDLHLNNICLWHDELMLFDCIEFNKPFRFVDVMFDIAYIVMDLEVGQRRDLSTRFLNTYVEQTGDWDGLAILPIYVSRQTYVRAKVTSFLLNDPAISAVEKEKAHKRAALYYHLAWQYTQRQQGQVILISGLSGAGKSTTARHLAAQIGAIHIRSDAVRKHLAGIPLVQRGDDSLYTPEMTEKTYHRLQELGIKLAAEGYSVILDAKYDRPQRRVAVQAQAEAHGLPYHVLYCDAPADVRRSRLQFRTGDVADATADLVASQYFEPFTADEQPHVQRLDATQTVETQLTQVIPLLNAPAN
ncbi:MAG: AAA family ATPase [Synechococcales bacterium]|nr:AAA family ATPase [Synechococcales bacterium]